MTGRWIGLCAAGWLLVAACGGSASETPWPVEPVKGDNAPAGEELTRGNVVDTKKLPDNYSKRDGGAAEAEEPPLDDEEPKASEATDPKPAATAPTAADPTTPEPKAP